PASTDKCAACVWATHPTRSNNAAKRTTPTASFIDTERLREASGEACSLELWSVRSSRALRVRLESSAVGARRPTPFLFIIGKPSSGGSPLAARDLPVNGTTISVDERGRGEP